MRSCVNALGDHLAELVGRCLAAVHLRLLCSPRFSTKSILSTISLLAFTGGLFRGTAPCGADSCPGLSDRHEPDLETKARHYPLWARSNRVSHPGPSCPHGLRGAGRGVARGLMFHLASSSVPSRMTIAEIHNQVMKPMTAPKEP